MQRFFAQFVENEEGAVTVDWVVLTAAICALGAIIVGYIANGNDTMASNIETELTNATVPTITW